MKNITFYLVLIIIILAGLTYTFYDLNKKHRADAARWEKNAQETNKKIQQQNLTLDEFKKYMDSKTDSLLEIAKIKPKNVTQITNYNTYYTDTTITENKLAYEPISGTYPFIDKQGCFEFGGFIDLNDSLPEINVNKRKFNSDFTEIEYYKKDTIYFLGLKAVKWWQKKVKDYTIIDNCTGAEIKTKKVIIN